MTKIGMVSCSFVGLCVSTNSYIIINPRRACAARVTVVGFVCLCVYLSVCMSVCALLYISPLECLFVPETIPSTQRAMKVRK